MRQRRSHVAKRRRKGDMFGGAQKAVHGLTPAIQNEAHHIAEPALQQIARPVVVGMIGAAGIKHPFHARHARQRLRQLRRVRLRPVITQIEGRQSPLRQPAIEGGGGESPSDGGVVDRLVLCRIVRDGVTQHRVRMSGQQLGDRVNDHVRAVLERAPGARRGKGVVDGEDHAPALRDLRDRLHVGDPQRGVGDDFDQDHPRLRPDRRFKGGGVGRVGQRRFDPEARHVLGQQAQGPAVELIACNHMVARLKQGQHDGGNGAHAGSGNDALAPFRRHALQPVDLGADDSGVRMTFTAVGEALLASLILRVQLIRVARGVDDRGLDRGRDGPRDAGGLAGAANEGSGIMCHARQMRRAGRRCQSVRIRRQRAIARAASPSRIAACLTGGVREMAARAMRRISRRLCVSLSAARFSASIAVTRAASSGQRR